MLVPGAGRGGEAVLMGTELQLGEMEGSRDRQWGWQHSHVSVLNAAELCIKMVNIVHFVMHNNRKHNKF
jgi:hypothetical protein